MFWWRVRIARTSCVHVCTTWSSTECAQPKLTIHYYYNYYFYYGLDRIRSFHIACRLVTSLFDTEKFTRFATGGSRLRDELISSLCAASKRTTTHRVRRLSEKVGPSRFRGTLRSRKKPFLPDLSDLPDLFRRASTVICARYADDATACRSYGEGVEKMTGYSVRHVFRAESRQAAERVQRSEREFSTKHTRPRT